MISGLSILADKLRVKKSNLNKIFLNFNLILLSNLLTFSYIKLLNLFVSYPMVLKVKLSKLL